MGAERFPTSHSDDAGGSPLILGLQASALVDHVARIDRSLLDQIPGERGGSSPVLSLALSFAAYIFSIFNLFTYLGHC